MGKRHVRLTRYNWDIMYYTQMSNGLGFTITEPVAVTIDGIKKKTMYGPRSELYGTTYGDEQEFAEQYTCQCGSFKGKQFEGEICPVCKHPVKSVGDNIKITGWISLGDNKVINPYYFQLLTQVIGKNVFPDIVIPKLKVDKNGVISNPDLNVIGVSASDNPYYGIGVDGFRENFYEIMAYFKKKKGKARAERFDLLTSNVRSIFTSHIPVYSTKLRQQSITSDTFYYGGVDKNINPIISLSKLLEDCSEIERPNYLQSIQKKVNTLWEYNFELLNDKEGIIRGQINGGALNYTSRNVIVSDKTLRDNEVDVSYPMFLELYKGHIIKTLMVSEGITLSEANHEWECAKISFNDKVYQTMLAIVKNDNPHILLNRNPTLNWYSMLLLKIRNVLPFFNNYTLAVPLSILPGLNADFDGDILNIIGLMMKEIIYMFRKFNPVERMIMSRESGKLNEYFAITKGQLIDLMQFAICDVDVTELDHDPYIKDDSKFREWQPNPDVDK